jgi:hypothetical protein
MDSRAAARLALVRLLLTNLLSIGMVLLMRKRRTEFENERPPDAKAPPRAGKVMREGPPETASVRAKSSGHGKKTADKWNQ